MSRPAIAALAASALLLTGVAGCAELRDRSAETVRTAGELTDRVRFCLSLARAMNAIDSGSPDVARDAIEEAVTQAPDDLLETVRRLADRFRGLDGDPRELMRAPDVQEASEDLRQQTEELCDPTV